jgi:two-component system NtrC family sensor kinase
MSDYPEQHSEKSIESKDRSEHTRDSLSRSGPLDAAILQSLPIGIVAFDSDLKIVEANPVVAQLIEIGQTIDTSLAKGTDGKIWQSWTQLLTSAISTGQTALFDDVDYTFNGKTRRLRIRCSALKATPTTKILGGTMIIEDVTERANMERRLANVERLAIVGKHASKVAHELNNPLDGILRYINLAMRIVERENLEKPMEYLAQCRRGLMRMIKIVGDLLEYSRSAYAPMEYTKVEQIIEETVKTMEPKAEASGISILRDYARDLPQIRNGNLFQVFCNLTKNALDAMENGGQLKIATRLGENDTIVVEFRDTGTGLPQDNVEAIFEPFFTTKGDKEGTGLGLAICRDIIESYNGRITAENGPGGGSIFTVYVPVGT